MFKTKNTTNKTTITNEKLSPFVTAKSWIEGKLGSVLIGSAIGYSLYHFGIIKQIINYLKKSPTVDTASDKSDTHTH